MDKKKVDNPKKLQLLKERLKKKYRLVILNESTFEEKAAISLSQWNVYVVLSSILVGLTVFIIALIIFTPLKEYIPGYADTAMRKNVKNLYRIADSLENEMKSREIFLSSIRNVLSDSIDKNQPVKTENKINIDVNSLALKGKYDSLLKEKAQKFLPNLDENLNPVSEKLNGMLFFIPCDSYISSTFNKSTKHFGIDFITPKNQAVKATLSGTVVFSGNTQDEGYVIVIQHAANIISVYKYCSSALKKNGTFVKAGDIIAFAGIKGEYSTSPHLHFEIWLNGVPVDPKQFLIL